ncbi:hypothetical protein FQR65_LT15792 [Abscondita terminalis]|nr:hypothetical protein FQR65_LT15792 [Abscondita terminalis]
MDLGRVCAHTSRRKGNLKYWLSLMRIMLYHRIEAEFDGKKEPWYLLFKNETHNHPTEIEPFGGASTCLGGAIRDPLSGRSFVYQAMRLSGAADVLEPVEKSLPGSFLKDYFLIRQQWHILLWPREWKLVLWLEQFLRLGYAVRKPQNGDFVIILGGATGRDGSVVQQERMAVVISPEDKAKFIGLCEAENIKAVHVATVTDSGRMQIFWKGDKIVDLSREFLDTNGCAKSQNIVVNHLRKVENKTQAFNEENFLAALKDKNVASQKGLLEMFDSSAWQLLGGKDSMSGTYLDLNVPPTLISFACANGNKKDIISPNLRSPGINLFYGIESLENGLPNYEELKNIYDFIYAEIKKGNIVSVKTIKDGGLLQFALAKMSFGNHLGAEISADDKVLLEKNLASLVIESTGNIENILIKEIGVVNSSNILKINNLEYSIDNLLEAWTGTFKKLFPTEERKGEVC